MLVLALASPLERFLGNIHLSATLIPKRAWWFRVRRNRESPSNTRCALSSNSCEGVGVSCAPAIIDPIFENTRGMFFNPSGILFV